MKEKSEYCPLCGAHEFEWNEGESTDKTILKMEKDIENLIKKYTALRKVKDDKTDKNAPFIKGM